MHPDFEPIRLRSLLASRKGAWGLSLLLGWLTLLAVVGLLAISGWFITASAAAGLVVAGAYQFDFFRPAALIRLAAMTRTAGRYAERLSSHNAALALLQDLRCRLFAKLAKSPWQQGQVSAKQQHRLIGDIDLLDQFPLSVIAPWFWALSILAVIGMFYYWLAPSLFWLALPSLLLAGLALQALLSRQLVRLAQQDTELVEARKVFLLESLQMRAQLVIWQQWGRRTEQFSATDQAYLQQHQYQQRASSALLMWQQWGLGVGLLLLLWQGGILVQQQQLGISWLVAALLAYLACFEILAPLTASATALGHSQAARDRLNQLGSAEPEPQAAPLVLGTQSPSLQLDALQWSFTQAQPLNLNVQAGEILLLSGASGGGKTSLLETLAGYLAPVSGRCTLNGEAYTQQSVRPHMAYLPQQFDLFNLSLADNLRLGNPQASDARLWEALAKVALDDWAAAQPLQLQTPLGEYGLEVSGGQARRIALARLLLRQQAVMLLDEPFAGLDEQTAQQVMNTVIEHQRQGVLVVVSHSWPAGVLNLPQVQQIVIT